MTAVFSSLHPLVPPELIEFELGKMEAEHAQLHPGFTLYLPPVRVRPIVDKGLLRELNEVAHLRAITEPED